MKKHDKGSLAEQLKAQLGLGDNYVPQEEEKVEEKKNIPVVEKDCKIIVALEKKGRAGKQVTIVRGFDLPDKDLEPLAALLKKKCGVGGAVKDSEIIIQGDCRDKLVEILKQENFNAKRGN